MGHYKWFIKGCTSIEQPLYEHLSGEGASKKSEQVMLTEEAKGAYEMFKKACLKAPVLAFADFDKPFLLKTDTSKLGLEAMLSQKQTDGWYHPVAYASQALTSHELNYHSMKQEFLALNWVITKQFWEYLLWKLFIVRTDNNPLTYVMTTPNLDATQHHWIESLVRFRFSNEYQKGHDMLLQMLWAEWLLRLDAETVRSILDGVTMGMVERADAHDPVVANADEDIHNSIQETAILAHPTWVNPHVTDWVDCTQCRGPNTQDCDQVDLRAEGTGPKTPAGKMIMNTEEGKIILWEWKKLMLYQGALYHCHTSAGELEEVLQFMRSPRLTEWLLWMDATQDAGHQGQQQTLCLLHDWFWWPGMAVQMQKAISNCKCNVSSMKASMLKPQCDPSLLIAPFELLHSWLYQHQDDNGGGSPPKQ